MTKYIKVSVVSLVILFSIFSGVTEVLAWDDCPFGLVDDPYPGECPRYVDTDNDGLCDHSQLAPEDRVDATAEIVEEVTAVEPTEDVVDDTSVNTNTISNTNSSISTDSVNTNINTVSNTDDNKIAEVVATSVEEDKDKSKLIKGLIAIFLPLIAILGYVIWQKKKLK
ncbi:MAG: hypothetical protein ACNFW9_02955 [Candidatus Kerfeldbacteria bacterium]|jgi:hypothetical protein